MEIALLSNATVELLAATLGGRHRTWTPPGFGAWMETALAAPASFGGFAPEAVFLLLDPAAGRMPPPEDVRAAKDALERAFPLAQVFSVDMEDLAAETPGFHDERFARLAASPWSLAGMRAVAAEVDRLLGLAAGGAKKVLALDFDGVLWRGVVAEDGRHALAPYAGFQRRVKAMKERGVVLVGLSANNAADVEPVWSDPRMLLGRGDFAALRLDWNPKPDNLVSAARELNLSPDSFVFIDDNPAQRERMKAELPAVATPDFPERADEETMERFARHVERIYFPEMRRTAEDAARTERYLGEAKRRRFAASLDAAEYLKRLEMRLDVHEAREDEFARVAQLSQKSNQFNATTRRRTAPEIASLAASPEHVVAVAKASDRFGDLGLVAFIVAKLEGDRAEIEDWVMSCRAMNRRIEFAFEERFEEMLCARGVRHVAAEWRGTAKNAPSAGMFDAFGYRAEGEEGGTKRYAVELPRKTGFVHYAAFA